MKLNMAWRYLSMKLPPLAIRVLKTGALIAIALSISYGAWFGLQAVLGTPNPWVVVISGSMETTYYRGDLLFVQGVKDSNSIEERDVITFYNPLHTDELIVHRVVSKLYIGDQLYFKTQGDNRQTNPHPDPWNLDPELITGRVIFEIPTLGHVVLVMQSQVGPFIISILIITIFILDLYSTNEKRE